jgi:hypothetical protein
MSQLKKAKELSHYDRILSNIMKEYWENKEEQFHNNILDEIIEKKINEFKDEIQNEDDIEEIFNKSSIDKQVDFMKLIFSLNNYNMKYENHLIMKFLIKEYDTIEQLLFFGIKNNMC